MTISRYTDKKLDAELASLDVDPVKDQVIRLRREGNTYKAITVALGISKGRARDICLSEGLGGGSLQRLAADIDPSEILALREVGFSYRVIVKKLGVPKDVVSRVCHDAGLSPGAPLYRSKTRHPRKEEILALRREGYVYHAIADKLDVPLSVAHKICAGEVIPKGHGTLGRKDQKIRDSQKTRVEGMRKLREEGKTLVEIGNIYGVTRERVRQVCEGIACPDLRMKRNCAECGKEFVHCTHTPRHGYRDGGQAKYSSVKYCSRKCGQTSAKRKMQKPDSKWSNHGFVELICTGCGKTFTRSRRMYALAEYYREREGKTPHGPKYCTQACYLNK